MNERKLSGLFLCTCVLLSSAAIGQTATWIAPGRTVDPAQDWTVSTNWDTGIVPNSSLDIAVFNAGNSVNNAPAAVLAGTDITLDRIQYSLPNTPASNPLSLPVLQIDGALHLVGAGIVDQQLGQVTGGVIINPNLFVNGLVEFRNQASYSASGSIQLGVRDVPASPGTMRFLNNSTLTGRNVWAWGSSVVEFAQNSRAETGSVFFLGQGFNRDGSRAQGSASLIFRDDATAGVIDALLIDPQSSIVIRDRADVSHLGISNLLPLSSDSNGTVDISAAAGDVTLRRLEGNMRINLGANTLRFDQLPADLNMSLHGEISGTGGLAFLSPGTILISNPNNTYTGATQINGASVSLFGGRISNVTFDLGGLLSGSGTVSGNLTNDRGTVLLIGTLRVQGNFIQTPNLSSPYPTVLRVNPGNLDQLVVDGTAQLGGTLFLTGAVGPLLLGSHHFIFLTAASVTGQFATITSVAGLMSNSAMRTTRIVYTPTAVSLAIEQRPFATINSSASRLALGAHVDAVLATGSALYTPLLVALNALPSAASVEAALDQLSPDRYGVLVEQAFTAAAAQQAALDRRLAASRFAQEGHADLFFEGSHRRTNFEAVAGLPEADFTTSQGTAGGQWRAGSWTLGAMVTSANSRGELDANGSQAKTQSVAPGIFSEYVAGRFFINAAASFSRDEYDLSRHLAFPGFAAAIAVAKSHGRSTDLALNTGYEFRSGGWAFTPMIGVLNSRWRMNAFTETGAGPASMTFAGWSETATRSHVGLEISLRSAGGRFTPRLNLGWLHEFEKTETIQTGFAQTGLYYAAPGRPRDTDVVHANFTIDCKIGQRATLYGGAGVARGQNSSITPDLSAGLRWSF